MFSKEQIKEIQYKLGLLGMKDTAFPVASMLYGNETITIIQNSINKRTTLKLLAESTPQWNTDILTKNNVKTINGESIFGSGNIEIDLSEYQPLLVSGKNIKTINGQSLLGSGNINIQGGSGGGITEIPEATNTILGGIMLGFSQTAKKYPVQLSNSKAFVEVPWENTTYTFTPTNPTLSWGNTSVLGKVGDLEFKATMPDNPFPYTLGYTQSGKNYPVLQSNKKLYVSIPWSDTVYDDTEVKRRITELENKEDKDTTYTIATSTKDGLMSKEDKAKLDTYNPTLYTLKKTQAEYNALESAGTLDANTIYFIVG